MKGFYYCGEKKKWLGPWYIEWFGTFSKITGLYPYGY
jgi:hypothetical protein